MKPISGLCLVFAMAVGALSAAEAGFWEQLGPDERRAAGVDRLTPEQQAALDRLVGRFAREGATQVREEVKRDLKAEQKVREEARAGLPVDEKNVAVHSRIAGKFEGWSGHTVFRLENGQVWVQTNSGDSRWVPMVENPEVEIRPAGLGGWKLFLVKEGFWLHVRRVK
jgi:hypothetical protein